MVPDAEGAAVEILGTRPLTPDITLVEKPVRLVIDLRPGLLTAAKTLPFRSPEVLGVRVSQFQESPLITRIVVDLARPIGYSWDAAGNRLMIRLRMHPREGPEDLSSATTLAPVTSSTGTAITRTGSNQSGSAVSAGWIHRSCVCRGAGK
jgi:hypothetical protein